MNTQLNPARILETATAFWPSKVLLSAIELGVFTQLAQGPMTGTQLSEAVGIRRDRSADFFDSLVALSFLERKGAGQDAVYENTPETDLFLDKNKPAYAGGMPEMLNSRLFGFWNHLTEALQTGKPQNEVKNGGESIFEALYADEHSLSGFLSAMASIQTGNFMTLAERFAWAKVKTVVDVGGGSGAFSAILARRHAHLEVVSFDLPAVASTATSFIKQQGLSDRVTIASGSFLEDALPHAEVIVMGNVLHDWDEPQKQMLIQKAYDALPKDGVLIAIENVVDDDRRSNAFGLMMSLNMLIETGADGGFDYTGAQFDGWCKKAGFQNTEIMPLVGPASAAIAYK